jgi:hypothetical protein
MTFLKNDSELLTFDPRIERPVKVGSRAAQASAAAQVYNRLGRLLTRLGARNDVEVATIIAVWLVQTGGRGFLPGRPYLHFEVARFFDCWGHHNRQEFDAYFRFGGRSMQQGCGWENQEYREDDGGLFLSVHHNQNTEYAALTMARTLAGDGPALLAASIGGCLLSAGEFTWAGYNNPVDMFEAFQESERAQVLGFFDYCGSKPTPKTADLLRHLRTHDWALFAKNFPTDDQPPLDVERLRAAYAAANTMMRQAG